MKKQANFSDKPHVGVGIIIRQKNKIVLGRRLKQPMPGSWQLPGGWIRLGESPEQAVERQLKGFTELKYSTPAFVAYTNNVFDKNRHSLSLYFKVNCLNKNQLDLQENSQCADWTWADWNDLPQPLFLPLQLLKQTQFQPIMESM